MPYIGCSGPLSAIFAQKAHERLAFGEVAQPAQRLDDEGGVAEPAEAVIPGAARAERFGNAGGRRGDDRAGVVVGVQLEAQRGAQHRLRRERRQRAGLGPDAPAADRLLERGLGVRRRLDVRRLAGAQREEDRPIDSDRRCRRGCTAPAHWSRGTGGSDRRRLRGPGPRRRSRRWRARSRAADRSAPGRAACPAIGHEQPAHLDRRIDLQALQDARREVVDLEAAVRRLDLGAHHVGVADVAAVGAPVLDGLERPRAAALLIEQPREDRRAVEARQAQPVDAGVGSDEGEDAAVADRAVMQRQRLSSRRPAPSGGWRRTAARSPSRRPYAS